MDASNHEYLLDICVRFDMQLVVPEPQVNIGHIFGDVQVTNFERLHNDVVVYKLQICQFRILEHLGHKILGGRDLLDNQ
jgi:hypothetical protein